MYPVITLFIVALSFQAYAVDTNAPDRLSETGLYSDIRLKTVNPSNLSFSPQYPLWTDGARKLRWIYLPAGAKIDNGKENGGPGLTGGTPDRWVFPVGAKLWKEFRFKKRDDSGDFRRVETRYMIKVSPDSWLLATYIWNENETEATKVDWRGIKNYYPIGNGISVDVPGQHDCRSCHNRGGDKPLGFDALQISDDRDPLAVLALQSPEWPRERPENPVTLRDLADRGILTYLPKEDQRIHAKSMLGRTVMGYLHGNCGHCHNPEGAAKRTELFFRHESSSGAPEDEPAYRTAVNQRTKFFQIPNVSETYRLSGGDPDSSAVLYRSRAIDSAKMPPIGRKTMHPAAVRLIELWIWELQYSR